MNDQHLRPITPLSAALALLCAALWGANAPAAQMTQEDLPALGTAGLRFLISVPFLVLWFKLQGSSLRFRREEWFAILLTAVFIYAQIGSFHFGQGYTNSSHSSLIIGLNPVVVAVIAHFFLKGERLNAAMVLGLAAAVVGLCLIMFGKPASGPAPGSGQDPVSVVGDLIIVASCIVLGLRLVTSKHFLRRVDPGRLLVWAHLLGSLMLLSSSAAAEGFGTYRFTVKAVWGLAFMGIVIAVFCFAVWMVLLQRHPASQLQVFGFAQPVCGVFLGSLWRGDRLTLWVLLGTVTIVGGIALVTWGGNRRKR